MFKRATIKRHPEKEKLFRIMIFSKNEVLRFVYSLWDVNMDGDDVVLSFYDSLLRKSDVDLLDGNRWLNDGIVGFVYE